MAITAEKIPAGTWTLDPTHSEVSFSVRHLAISKVKGSFERFDASLVTDDDHTASKVTASIDVASINTNQKDRDGHLQTGDFFLAEEHPQMTFTSTSIEEKGDDAFLVHGDLSLRGVTKPVTLKSEFGGLVVDGYGQTKLGFSATTKIDRTEFGVSWNAALEAGGFTLGNDVTVTLEIQFVLSA
ncbi:MULTISPECIES: YceI family protein [Frigoribacterium]|jgi:polyisoprenoid-binding protein YceI|uniref:YceI family protein n=1 Tax=Frigoribacterium TaxID=96492 RepID=UPI0006FDEA5B|nr:MULTISPECIES: YceI family protein [Frigoribacterium]KQR43796.1 polyisoprenoid-binding protein [Frigoribacterium sp. Leaf164]MBD8660067.1 YceI family protein [Frigoribacterium sp. CFBP 8754]MBD8726412.1 YceI family protein [Frigoribacterium sp. CFBP 13707]NII51288.1 polyisoprenoid-binding protein YceI [Frigoribacterium endophyticum]QNE43166.1 YceI family protein [Frigoribacterium sp. NBH87]